MKLMMYIGNDLIEAVAVEQESIPVPGYLGRFKRELKAKHQELIDISSQSPEFIVADPMPQGYNAEVQGNFLAKKAS